MANPYRLFQAYGIELEYMIVAQQTLDILPVADKVFAQVAGAAQNTIPRGDIDWSNELVAHVVELKNPEPTADILGLAASFQREVQALNNCLSEFGGQLLPGAAHPWMNPDRETRLWPHGDKQIYEAFNKIFGCHGHGWSNLQSMHINLAFNGAEEFEKLHSAVRCVLPLIPALCASSPILDGKKSGAHCTRLLHYLENQKRIPAITGLCIPEYVSSPQDYEEKILQPMYREISPFDPDSTLQEEWLNSRGAIAKFAYGCIEIRLADIQENPKIDLAIAWLVIEILKNLTAENWCSFKQVRQMNTQALRQVLDATIQSGENAVIESSDYLALFGSKGKMTAQELLIDLIGKVRPDQAFAHHTASQLIKHGTLSTRILKSAASQDLSSIYRQLARCLAEGIFYEA